ncbi:hypothetical protein PG988_004577 [Apiospora saccharicola]
MAIFGPTRALTLEVVAGAENSSLQYVKAVSRYVLPTNYRSIIIVHGLRKWPQLEQSFEETVKKAAASQGNEAPRIRRFRFNVEDVFERGEKAFIETYKAFKKSIKHHVTPSKLLVRHGQSGGNAQDSGLSESEQEEFPNQLQVSGRSKTSISSIRKLGGRFNNWVSPPKEGSHRANDAKVIGTIIQLIIGGVDLPRRKAQLLKEKLTEYQYFEVNPTPKAPQPVEATISDSPKPEFSQSVETTISYSPVPDSPQPFDAARLNSAVLEERFLPPRSLSPRVNTLIETNDDPKELQGLTEVWDKRSEWAKFYLENCSFHNATALYESCIVMAKDMPNQGSAIELRCRMQLAVIKTMRGQYQNAMSDLRKLEEECKMRLGDSDPTTSAGVTYHHAVVLVRVGEFKEAIVKLETLSSILQKVDDMSLHANRVRLLGLANAYLGQFRLASGYMGKAKQMVEEESRRSSASKATTSEPISGTGSDKDPGVKTPLTGLEATVRLSEAQVLLMQGRSQEGLSLVEALLGDMEKSFGTSHVLTLEARFIWCRLLTETGRLGKAKAMCLGTIDLMTKYLDRDHPFILKATSALVGLHKLDACPSEATTTSENLAYRARELLGPDNRQTLRYEFQMASVKLWMGDYVNALKRLEEAMEKSRKKWGSEHPWTLSCTVEYSIALSICGQSEKSKEALENVLRLQSHLFKLGIEDCKGDTFVNRLIEYLTSVSQQNKDFTKVHPSLLDALGAWAKNELTRCDTERDQVIRAQTAILQIRKISPSFQPGQFATLKAGLDLANTLRVDPDPERSKTAESHYSEVVDSGAALHGHPIILLAEQGHYLSKMIRKPDDMSDADTERFLNIPRLMSLRLGSGHPDTLQALLTTLAPAYCLNPARAAEMSTELQQQLYDPKVRLQRPIECIQIEEKLGIIHYRLENRREAAEVFAALAKALRNGERAMLKDFDQGREIEKRLDQEISKIVGEVLEAQWQRAEDSKENGHYAEAVELLRLFHGLFKAVHGEYEAVTDTVSLNLAVALWRAGQQGNANTAGAGSTRHSPRRQQEEAVSILQGIVTRTRDEDLKSRLAEGLRAWEEELATASTVGMASRSSLNFAESMDSTVSRSSCTGPKEKEKSDGS